MRVAGIPLGVLSRKINLWLDAPFSSATQLMDVSGNARTFQNNYGTSLNVGTIYDANGALQFDGSSSITTSDVLRLTDKDFEISCDVYITSGSDFYSVFLAQRINSSLVDMEFYSLADGRLLVNICFTDTTSISIVGTAIRNQWQAVKLKRVGSTFTLTVDGVDTVETSNKTISSNSSGVFNIGSANNDGSASGNPTGAIRNLKIKVG